jgi:hypothetical protein
MTEKTNPSNASRGSRGHNKETVTSRCFSDELPDPIEKQLKGGG